MIDESLFVPFFLEDSTGRVLVNPQGAQLDVHRSFSDEVRTFSFGTGSVIPENIKNFVIRRGLLRGEKLRLEEQIIKPEFPLFAFGTLGDNDPGLTSWTPIPHSRSVDISFGSGVNPLSGSGCAATLNFNFKTVGSGVATKAIAEMLARLAGTKTVHWEVKDTMGGAPIMLPDSVLEGLSRLGIPLPPVVTGQSAKAAAALTVTVKSQTATAVAEPPSALQAPSATASAQASEPADPRYDLHARVAISKGERGDPFTISSQSQREVVQALAWKSTLYIWASPIFTLVCIYFLIVYWASM